jgi:hypothetical protein
VFPFFLEGELVSTATQGNAYRPIGVLLGGLFALQRSIEPKRVVCALLRAPKRLAEADDQMHSIGFAFLDLTCRTPLIDGALH